MSFLLDTCVLSAVVRWLDDASERSLHLSALTVGEIQRGIYKLPGSARRKALLAWLHDDLHEQFAGRVLPVDADVALTWGRVQARAEKRGRPVPVVDGLIAATALANDLIVVTRDGEHMEPTGVEIVNPWKAP